MESANAASSQGVLVPVPEASDEFQNNILATLKSAYLYGESKQSFEYKSAFLLKNPELEEKYNAFRAKKRAAGYTEEDLKESYGFLLFDDVNKANSLGESGVLTGNSTCTTLGDPSKGVYISMYSDCLDLNRWYHGKSGFIAILRLTKGRVKKTLENYTLTFTVPTVGFDCHVSEQLPSVSDKTSSFLAFERTQYYMYELLEDGSSETSPSPSAVCPYAIVSFSYTDTKATPVAPHQESEEKKLVRHFFPWRGQLQIVDQFYDIRLRSPAGALIPAELPPVIKVDQAISMLDLRRLLPAAVFETCSLSGEVLLDGLFCSVCEFVSSEVDETNSLSLLLCEVKEKNIALPIPLNDVGFLILVHSSHFSTYDNTGSSVPEVLQGVFVFPDSRVIQKDTKCGHRNPAMTPEILRVLPVLSYAEGEVEKTPIDSSEELSEVIAQHMQNYAALINPGLESSPLREVSVFADQYDVPDAHKHLYISPEWTDRAWQSLQSYLSKPVAFQLPVAKASEILMAEQENQIEDLDDGVYICVSSPEEVPTNAAGTCSEDQLAGQESCMNVGTSVTSSELPVDLRVCPQKVEADDLHVEGSDKGTEKSELRELIKTDTRTESILTPSTSDELPAELIVSITSAERTDESQTTDVNTLNDDTVKTKKLLDDPDVNNLTKTKCRKVRRGPSKGRKKVSNTWVQTPSLSTVEMSVESDNSTGLKKNLVKESVDHQQSSKPTITDWRKRRRRKRIFGKLSQREKKVRSCTVRPSVAEEKKTDPVQKSVMELEAFPLRRKTERWDLKPVLSECGRILVPHGSVDIADKIKSLKDKLQSRTNEQEVEKLLVVASKEGHDATEMEQKASTASETTLDKIETTSYRKGGDDLKNVSPVSLKHSTSIPLDAGNDSSNMDLEIDKHLSKNHGTDTSPPEEVQENHSDVVPTVKCPTKAEFLLSKLKSVLLRGKRKMGLNESEKMTDCATEDTEPCLKMSKEESDTGILKSNETNLDFKDVSKVLSVDPIFAYALGLTPKEIPKMGQKTESLGVQQSEDSSQTQEQTFDKQCQIIQRPPSIFPRGRIKTLKKHQDVSAENVKKKWWLHFQTPACFEREKHNNKECTRDNSVNKTVGEKLNSSCPSTDALNLLADLALSASHDEVPPQPTPALGKQPETSLKKCDLTKDVTSLDQESVLHALLRQPAARPIQTLESPSPSHPVVGSELVDLVSIEHAYSLPPSSSLPLGLPGTPFNLQVSPLSGYAGLLQHQRTMCEDGSKTLNLSAVLKDKVEKECRAPDYLKRALMSRRKFRHSRTFVNKNDSVQVTKQWKENYDFNLDSKFASDSKDGAIIRALHGPWDYSVQDTSEELRLIVHMWIGLFYSRSTPRLFHIDSDLTLPCSEESDSLELTSALVSSSSQSELKAYSDAHLPNEVNTSDPLISRALDLCVKDDSALNQGVTLDHGSIILDLSVKNSNAEVFTSDSQVSNKDTDVPSEWNEASKTLNTQSSMGQQKTSPSKVLREIVLSKKIIKEVIDVRSTDKHNRTNTTLQKVGQLEHAKVSFVPRIPEQKAMENVTIQPEKDQTASGVADMLQGCYNDKTDMKDNTGSLEATEISFVQPLERVLAKPMMDDSNKEAGDGVQTFWQNKIEPKCGEKLEGKEKLHQDDDHELCPKSIKDSGDSAVKDLGVVCHENILEDEKQLSREEPMAVSQNKAVNVNVDCCAMNEDKVVKEDHFGEDNRHVEKGVSLSAMDTEKDAKNPPSSVMCNSQDLVKKDDITKYTCPANLNEQLPQAENTESFHDLQLTKICANGGVEHAISEKDPHSSSNMGTKCNKTTVEENTENDDCSADKTTKESTCSLDGPNVRNSIPQTNNRVETLGKNKVMTSFNLTSDDHEHWDTKSVETEHMVDNTTDTELSGYQSHSPQCEQIQSETDAEVTKEMDQISGKSNEELEKCNGRVVIPFIGIDISGVDTLLPHDSLSQDKMEETVQGQEEKACINETTYPETVLPTGVCNTSQMNSEKAKVSSGKVSRLPIPENKPWASGVSSDDRCPTPTLDEKPYETITSSDSGCYPPTFSGSTFVNQKCFNRSSVTGNDEVPIEQKPCKKSAVNRDSGPYHGLHPDLELRTLRVFQSIDQFLSKSKLKITNNKSAPVSSSPAQDLHTESPGHFLISPFKSKIEEVLGVGLQLKKTDSSVHHQCIERTEKSQGSSGQGYCQPLQSLSSTSNLGAIMSNVDQNRHTTPSQANLSHEPCASSQRPVMAVKPSKSDDSQADSLSKDRQLDNSIMFKFTENKQSIIPFLTSATPTTMLLEKKTEYFKGISEGINNDAQEDSKCLAKNSWLPHGGDTKSKYDKATLVCQDPLYQKERRDSSKYNSCIPSSSLPVQACGSIKSSSQLVNGKHDFLTNSLPERISQTAKESLDMDQNDCLSASTPLVDYKDDNNIDDSLYLGPDSSLTCTVYNTSRKRSHSFLEKLSLRCIQEDPTEASMEQECLIFSDKMKQLLKRSKKESIHQPDSHEQLNVPCPSPVTVHFSGLEEQEGFVDHLDAQSFFRQKIKVHMSDVDDLEATTEGERDLHSKKSSQGASTTIEHAGVSTVTAACAELYEEKMNNVCAVRRVPSTLKHMERGYPKSEPSNYFDFCDQMKREMDSSFRSSLNSVVKKARKTKYRFYILETSDDVFFEETKVLLKAEGHTAVNPSEFFLDMGSSSSVLIILRNEDIAEHICEVPHLLALKKSPGVQFAGIDETDDVVNLTHQELFTKGGLIMLDGAALEPLSLCDMKKMSEILQELSKTGKWKWMLHYRDSRRLKENARLSQEAKEKKQLLNWCQEAGIVEVLPYHECDLMSKDQPDYLTCLVRLQVQNISARYTVFITDAATDGKFESKGIMTMTFNSFLTCSPSEAFSV